MNYSELTKTNIKKLVHIYQLNYRNGKSPGLGDFLRGSFCFMQLAKLYNIDFDIDFSNHPMSKYLENVNKNEDIEYNNIEIYYDINLSRDKLIEFES